MYRLQGVQSLTASFPAVFVISDETAEEMATAARGVRGLFRNNV